MSRAARLATAAARLTGAEWRLLVECAVAAVAIEAALRLAPLARVLRWVDRPVAVDQRPDRAATERLARLARWPFRVMPLPATCLRVALTQVAVLRRHGVPASVRLGVRRGAAGLDFHAWVDCDGPLGEDPGAEGYRAFEPSAAGAIPLPSRSARWS